MPSVYMSSEFETGTGCRVEGSGLSEDERHNCSIRIFINN